MQPPGISTKKTIICTILELHQVNSTGSPVCNYPPWHMPFYALCVCPKHKHAYDVTQQSIHNQLSISTN